MLKKSLSKIIRNYLKIMYSGIKPSIGQFATCVNEFGQIYYLWEEKGYYLFTPTFEFHDGDFQKNSNGDLTILKNGQHEKIGYWFLQLDNTIFVCNEEEKIGFVLGKNEKDKEYADVYWATVITPPDAKTLNKLSLNNERNQIKNNPVKF